MTSVDIAAAACTPQREEVYRKIEQAAKLRAEGNEHFKNSDVQGALKSYYSVLFLLKGLDQVILQAFPHLTKSLSDSKTSNGNDDSSNEDSEAIGKGKGKAKSSVEEITDDEAVRIQKGEKEGKAPTQTEKEKTQREIDGQVGDELTAETKKTIGLIYTNMAACHVKKENWKRALDFAQQAITIDKTNSKALFREAQARNGLGEITKARAILQDLLSAQEDASVRAMLTKIDADEKKRDEKSKQQMKGWLNKNKSSTEEGSSSSSATTNEPLEPRFKEIEDEDEPPVAGPSGTFGGTK